MASKHSNHTDTTLIPAVGYIRMSTDKQEDSPARQRQDIKSLADRCGYQITKWYEDHGLTGTESANRPEFQRLLNDARAGKFQAVLLSEQSRMSREDIFDAMQHWRRFRDAGVGIVTCQRGELKFDNLGGVITALVDQYSAREESIRLADRVVSGKRLALGQGQRQGGAVLGYDREILDESGRVVRRVCGNERFAKPATWSSRLVVSSDERAVAAVRFIFQSVAGGMSYGAVARELNRRGYRMRSGRPFFSVYVKKLVTNPVYQGDTVAGRYSRGRFRRITDNGPLVFEQTHEPLVDRQTFARAQAVANERYRPQRQRCYGRFLLTGLVYLAEGGLRLTSQVSRSKSGRLLLHYTLPHRHFQEHPEETDRPFFRAEVIERGVLRKLREFLSDPKRRKSLCAEVTRRTQKTRQGVAAVEKRLLELRAKIKRATENLAFADRADMLGISQVLAKLRAEEDQLKEKVKLVAARAGGRRKRWKSSGGWTSYSTISARPIARSSATLCGRPCNVSCFGGRRKRLAIKRFSCGTALSSYGRSLA